MKKVFLIFVLSIMIINVGFTAKSVFSLDIVIPTFNDVTGRFDGFYLLRMFLTLSMDLIQDFLFRLSDIIYMI
ncbi:hypothetical protein [Marinitoga lauensis]|uniref:hypothetical protein n=1 Tax=Marinitoga lauensis TaxID=2201189 RepID=UPI001011F9F5|nr:hypothetical protein [Marinitoga lauensis]